MRRLKNYAISRLRLPGRLARAIRYYTRLNYTWHLSWVKAERT